MIEFKGIEDILDRLDNLQRQQVTEEALMKAALLVEGAAKQKAPKGIGELRRSISSRLVEGGAEVYTPLEYAPYVEYGTGLFAEEGGRQDVPWHYVDDEGNWHSTSGMKPRPYLRPALNENREEILRIFREGYKND